MGQSVGSALRRVTYHYWYHTGEIQAIRQMLGHSNLADMWAISKPKHPTGPNNNQVRLAPSEQLMHAD